MKNAGAAGSPGSCARLDWPAGTADDGTAHVATRPEPGLVLRDFRPNPAACDSRWCGDITYIAAEEGRLYLTAVIDIASRRVVGWATADHLRTGQVTDALRATFSTRRPDGPVIFPSGRGCQYTGREFAVVAAEFGARLSVGRTGQRWDNRWPSPSTPP